MSELRYGPPPVAAVWRKVVTIIATLVGPPAALVATFIAYVEWTGCFLGCSGDGNHVTGGLFGALAALLLFTGPLLAGTLLKRWSAVGFAVLGVVGVLAATVLKLGVL